MGRSYGEFVVMVVFVCFRVWGWRCGMGLG